MDEYIEQVAKQQRAIAQQHFQWMVDGVKDSLGMLEYAPREYTEEDKYFGTTGGRTLRRWKTPEGPRSEPYRVLPLWNGYVRLVRDKW